VHVVASTREQLRRRCKTAWARHAGLTRVARRQEALMRSRAQLAILTLVALSSGLAGCDWLQARFDAGQTGYNPGETHLGAANVTKLARAFTIHTNTAGLPVVAGSRLYVGDKVFDASGDDFPPSTNSAGGAVAIAGSREYAGLSVYDASAYCPGDSGNPLPCPPLWSYSSRPFFDLFPGVLSGSILYLPFNGPFLHGGQDRYVAAYDANGAVGCSSPPVVCGEMWSYPVNQVSGSGQPLLAVAGGRLFSTSEIYLDAYDANGRTNCSGARKVCHPLWEIARTDTFWDGAPVVAGNTVFARAGGQLFAMNAATGVTLWSSRPDVSIATDPAVANGLLYIGTADGRVVAYDATGARGCGGNPKTCAPLWHTAGGAALSAPSVANGVVFAGAADGTVRAFDAAGSLQCSGTPKTCAALWTAKLSAGALPPLIANGRLFVPLANHDVAVFATPG
jgi:outer membrane protein assembly factor BamB